LDEIQKQNKRCVLFAKSRSQAIAMNEYLKFNGIYSDLIIGRVGDSKRDEIISTMKAGKLTVIVNHNILSTGLDIPGLESIMILADIGSPTLALQTLGRAMRGELNGGNAKNSVYLTPSNYQNLKNFDLLEQITLNV
jgi:superfamily II DNA or RNA helicase